MNGNDSNKDVPSSLEVASFLREEGLFDPILSDQEMLELYQAVSNSKNTATAEDEKRRILEDSKQECDQIDELLLNSVPVSSHNLNVTSSYSSDASTKSKDVSPESSQKNSNNFDDIDVFNSVPTQHPPLPRISYKPKYSPPLYCNPKIKHLPLEEKIKLIVAYHKKLIHIYDSYQRRSVKYAPLSKPIQSDVNFHGSLLKTERKSNAYDFQDDKTYEYSQDTNSNDIYNLRSGRQTKRKMYFEDGGDEKKPKPSETYTPQSRKKSSIDIMSDDVYRSPRVTKSTKNRCEKLFDNLIETKKKQEETEKEEEVFLKSLQVVSDEDDFKEDIVGVQVEEPFIRRRVVPPSRGRGQRIRNSKANNTKTKKTASKKPQLNESVYEPLEAVTTNFSSSSQRDDYGTCPICNLRFPNDQLESHADQCIDLHEERSSPVGLSKITCEKCDQVLLLDMDYELHVQDCLAKSSKAS